MLGWGAKPSGLGKQVMAAVVASGHLRSDLLDAFVSSTELPVPRLLRPTPPLPVSGVSVGSRLAGSTQPSAWRPILK